MLRTSKRAASSGSPSMSHLPTRIRPAYLLGDRLDVRGDGPAGGHQTAVKSTSTGHRRGQGGLGEVVVGDLERPGRWP